MLRLVATFWRYVRIQLIVFVFGIVGPIFLIIFFATQPDPSMGLLGRAVHHRGRGPHRIGDHQRQRPDETAC
jgi:hypothetical protein